MEGGGGSECWSVLRGGGGGECWSVLRGGGGGEGVSAGVYHYIEIGTLQSSMG